MKGNDLNGNRVVRSDDSANQAAGTEQPQTYQAAREQKKEHEKQSAQKGFKKLEKQLEQPLVLILVDRLELKLELKSEMLLVNLKSVSNLVKIWPRTHLLVRLYLKQMIVVL